MDFTKGAPVRIICSHLPVFPVYKTRASIREMGSMVTKVWQRIKDHGLIFELHGLIFGIQFGIAEIKQKMCVMDCT